MTATGNPVSSPSEVLSKWKLVAYGGVALPLCLAEIPIILYLPAFYAQDMALGAGAVGAVFLLARLWDGLTDLLVGWLSDRSLSRFGRRKPWVLLGTPLLMSSTWFLCNPPAKAGLIYLLTWSVVFYASFTAVKIPHLSWGTELATGYDERNRVTTFRESFTMLGNLFFVIVPLVVLGGDTRLREVLFLIAMTTLVTVPLTAAPLGLFVRDVPPTERLETPLLKELAVLARDKVLIRFLVARLVYTVEEGVSNSLLVFSFDVGLNLPNKLFWAIFILYMANLCTLSPTLWLARRMEKHHLLALGMGIQALVYAGVLMSPSGNFPFVATLYIALGVANTAMSSMPTSILADIIDHGEMTTGERHSGAYVAVDNLIYKIGMAIGVGLSFGLVALIHFDPGVQHHSEADARNISLLGFGIPCLLSGLVAILYFRHPITRQVHDRIRCAIESRARLEPVVASGGPIGGSGQSFRPTFIDPC